MVRWWHCEKVALISQAQIQTSVKMCYGHQEDQATQDRSQHPQGVADTRAKPDAATPSAFSLAQACLPVPLDREGGQK